jgi:hypothetical protein
LTPARPCRLCAIPAVSNGLCHAHGERWRRWGRPDRDAWCAAFRAGRLCTCEVCGEGWNGYRGSLVCSPECRKVRKARIALARFHAKAPDERRADSLRAQDRARRRRHARMATITCACGCGATFTGFPHRRFATRACKDRDVDRRREEIRSRVREAQSLRLAAILLGEPDR